MIAVFVWTFQDAVGVVFLFLSAVVIFVLFLCQVASDALNRAKQWWQSFLDRRHREEPPSSEWKKYDRMEGRE